MLKVKMKTSTKKLERVIKIIQLSSNLFTCRFKSTETHKSSKKTIIKIK